MCLKLKHFEQSFSNHACLSMLDCKVLSYHFKSIYSEHHHFITNEKNCLTLKDEAIKLIVWFCRWKILTSVNLYTFVRATMDLFPINEQNFDLDKSGQKFHHSLKEHHKISNISKFRCEML